MHELSIAMSLVDTVCDELPRLGPVRVSGIHVRVGVLSGISPEALEFSFAAAAQGTPLEEAELVIERVPISMYCERCGIEEIVASPSRLVCPICESPGSEVVSGRELQLTAVEVQDDPDRGSAAEHPEEERRDRR